MLFVLGYLKVPMELLTHSKSRLRDFEDLKVCRENIPRARIELASLGLQPSVITIILPGAIVRRKLRFLKVREDLLFTLQAH